MICALSCIAIGLAIGFYAGSFWEYKQEKKRKRIDNQPVG
jgi:hypothetical protein